MFGVQGEFLCHFRSLEKCGAVTHAGGLKIMTVLAGYLSIVDQITQLFGQLFDLAQLIRDALDLMIAAVRLREFPA